MTGIRDEPRTAGAARLREIATGLSATGLVARLHRTRAGTDLTGTLRLPGRCEIEVIADEDGYTELRYWASLGRPATAAVATIASLLEVLTASRCLACLARPSGEPVAGYDGAVTECAEGSGMAGPQDHLTEQGRIPDQARPYEADNPHDARVRPDDLQGRLERLPINHPSSPYRDDGSHKPPPPDLSQYELPLPDEFADSLAEDRACIGPDGSWSSKDCHLTPDESHAADQGLAKRRDAEGRDVDGNYGDNGLTPAIRRVAAKLDCGALVEDTEKYALKEPDRFKERLAELIKDEPDKPVEQHVDEIHDGIRYTFVSDCEDYVHTVNQATVILKDTGFELGVRKNTWANDEYKGVNTRWRDHESGCRFEVQFHTHESWQVKQATHSAYARIQDTRTPTEERERLRAYQREISSALALPPEWESITNYRKEGW